MARKVKYIPALAIPQVLNTHSRIPSLPIRGRTVWKRRGHTTPRISLRTRCCSWYRQ